MDKLKDYISPNFFTNIDVFEKCLDDEPSFNPYGNQLDQFVLSKTMFIIIFSYCEIVLIFFPIMYVR